MKINKIAVLHIIIILAIFSTPLWLNWKLIIVYMLLNYLQIKIFGGCVVSQLQFKNKTEGFYRHYINKYFPNNKISEKNLNLILDYIIPTILVIVGYIVQH
jgi:hypothetical protein